MSPNRKKRSEEMEHSAEDALIESLTHQDVSGIAQQVGDAAFHAVIDEEILKDVPVFSILVRVWAVGRNFRDRIFLKKIASFLKEAGRISNANREAFAKRLEADPKFARRSGEKLLLLLDKLSELEKAIFMGYAFRKFLEGTIDEVIWNRICAALEFLPLWRLFELPEYYFKGGLGSLDQASATSYQQLGLIAVYYGDKDKRLHCDFHTDASYFLAYHQPFYRETDIGAAVADVIHDYLAEPEIA